MKRLYIGYQKCLLHVEKGYVLLWVYRFKEIHPIHVMDIYG
jgi:hypothetical protein